MRTKWTKPESKTPPSMNTTADKFLDDLITGLQKEWRAKDEQLATARREIERLQSEVRELREVIQRGVTESEP